MPDGDTALETIVSAEKPFDIVLLDHSMPGLTGLETVEQLRAAGINVPVLMVTGNCEPHEIARYLAAGAQDVLAKPFDIEALQKAMQAVLASSKPTPKPRFARRSVVGASSPITKTKRGPRASRRLLSLPKIDFPASFPPRLSHELLPGAVPAAREERAAKLAWHRGLLQARQTGCLPNRWEILLKAEPLEYLHQRRFSDLADVEGIRSKL